MRHRIEGQRRVRSTSENPSDGETRGRQSFPDEENDAEWLLDDPVLEVKNPKGREKNEAEKREQLVAPFHEAIYERPVGVVNPATGESACAGP